MAEEKQVDLKNKTVIKAIFLKKKQRDSRLQELSQWDVLCSCGFLALDLPSPAWLVSWCLYFCVHCPSQHNPPHWGNRLFKEQQAKGTRSFDFCKLLFLKLGLIYFYEFI